MDVFNKWTTREEIVAASYMRAADVSPTAKRYNIHLVATWERPLRLIYQLRSGELLVSCPVSAALLGTRVWHAFYVISKSN